MYFIVLSLQTLPGSRQFLALARSTTSGKSQNPKKRMISELQDPDDKPHRYAHNFEMPYTSYKLTYH
jgi:hypothetical protein